MDKNSNWNDESTIHLRNSFLELFDPLWNKIDQEIVIDESAPPLPPRLPPRLPKITVNEDSSDDEPPPPIIPRRRPDEQPPPLVDRHIRVTIDRFPQTEKLYEKIIKSQEYEPGQLAFYNMVKRLRSQYKFNDEDTNVGHIVAMEQNNQYPKGMKVYLQLYVRLSSESGNLEPSDQIEGYGTPLAVSYDVNTTVANVIHDATQKFCLTNHWSDYLLKPIGINEWLQPKSKLSQLHCVHQSIKLDLDLKIGLWPKKCANLNYLARTNSDDLQASQIKPDDILPLDKLATVNYDNLVMVLKQLEDHITGMESQIKLASAIKIEQTVKLVCALFGHIDTPNITSALESLKKTVNSKDSIAHNANEPICRPIEIHAERVSVSPPTMLAAIKFRCNRIRDSVLSLIETYSRNNRVDFCVKKDVPTLQPGPKTISRICLPVMVRVDCLHRTPPHWQHDKYSLEVLICHGIRSICEPVIIEASNEKSGLFKHNLNFGPNRNVQFNMQICSLPRESRLIFVLYGCTSDTTELPANCGRETKVELGWSAIQFFNYDRQMIQGTYLLPQWPPTMDKFSELSPLIYEHSKRDRCPILSIHLESSGDIVFPQISTPTRGILHDFNSLDRRIQHKLMNAIDQQFSSLTYDGSNHHLEELWTNRAYLHEFPGALPKILYITKNFFRGFSSVKELHAMIRSWTPLSPEQAFELLLPRYPDIVVRSQAVLWISATSNDQLILYLPQLVQCLKYETYEASTLAEFLLSRALESPFIAHHLYWLLVNGSYSELNSMMLRALLCICGKRLSKILSEQHKMCTNLLTIAMKVKESRGDRRKEMQLELEKVNQDLLIQSTSLPIGASFEIGAIQLSACDFFEKTNTNPLKIAFIGPDRVVIPVIFKAGDDLQQDMLAIQLIRVMDRMWLENGLDLKMLTFECMATGYKSGMIEMVRDAETLAKIQLDWGLTGSFKDKLIAEWLERHNPSQSQYQVAVDTFTASLAGYCVVTYILGVCDRHSDNIMFRTSGHLFHIDFGKVFGDAQMFGSIKRDRTPFMLTPEMAYVINSGCRKTKNFQYFTDLCGKAFNIVRKNGDLLLHLMALMNDAGITGVNASSIDYVQKTLLRDLSDDEAAATFETFINKTINTFFTRLNNLAHNFAQH